VSFSKLYDSTEFMRRGEVPANNATSNYHFRHGEFWNIKNCRRLFFAVSEGIEAFLFLSYVCVFKNIVYNSCKICCSLLLAWIQETSTGFFLLFDYPGVTVHRAATIFFRNRRVSVQ